VRAIEAGATTPRPFGPPRVPFEIPPSFFEPLPDDILDAFEGRSQRRASRAAGSSPAYGMPRRRKPRR
jgi:hypothetical protein